MKIDPQKFMLRQLKKEYVEDLHFYLSSGWKGTEEPKPKPPFMDFEEWLSDQNLTQDE